MFSFVRWSFHYPLCLHDIVLSWPSLLFANFPFIASCTADDDPKTTEEVYEQNQLQIDQQNVNSEARTKEHSTKLKRLDEVKQSRATVVMLMVIGGWRLLYFS